MQAAQTSSPLVGCGDEEVRPAVESRPLPATGLLLSDYESRSDPRAEPGPRMSYSVIRAQGTEASPRGKSRTAPHARMARWGSP